MTTGFQVADEARVSGALDLLARRIHAELGPEVRIVGILRRGAPLAEAIGRRLSELTENVVEVGTLRLKRYEDDLTVIHDEPELGEADFPFEVDGADVVLVDDVLYTGRTFLRAVRFLDAAGANTVRLAALCSRGGIEVPVRADFVAMRIDVGEGNVVEVHAPPFEDDWGIWLLRREELADD